MNKTHPTQVSRLYAAWRKAILVRSDFFFAHENAWTAEINLQYRILSNRVDRLWAEYLAARTGRTPEQVEASINDAIHSARD
jgi:hypothetical protein